MLLPSPVNACLPRNYHLHLHCKDQVLSKEEVYIIVQYNIFNKSHMRNLNLVQCSSFQNWESLIVPLSFKHVAMVPHHPLVKGTRNDADTQSETSL